MNFSRFKSSAITLVLLAFCQHSLPALATDRLAQKLSSSDCSFAGGFAQSKQLAGLNQPLMSEGAFYYHCQHGVIWKTVSPSESSLVFSKTGAAYRVEDGEVHKLGTRQGRVLGQLLNDLIGGDVAALEKQFEITDNASTVESSALPTSGHQSNPTDSVQRALANTLEPSDKFTLRPRKKSLKRAFTQINLDFSPAARPRLLSESATKLNSHSPTEDLTANAQTIRITMLDRHDQSTEITPTQSVTFQAKGNALQDCQQPPMTELACATLIPLPN